MRIEKINIFNGFDAADPDNARQNNYAWSMVEFNEYMYVGTARNTFYRGMQQVGLEPTASFIPDNYSMASEIWRYPIHKPCRDGAWERVWKMPLEFGACAFRCMTTYTNPDGVEALYGGSYYKGGQGYLLTSKDGVNWESIEYPLEPGYFIRPMIVHENKLYAANCRPLDIQETTYLYVADDVQMNWRRVNTASITGEIFSMQVFNGYLYLGAMPAGGFAIWKSKDPESGNWECVVDKGAGDALNEIPMVMEEFHGHLYVGSGINGAVCGTNPKNRWVLPKGFDLIRITKNDQWEVIVGKEPIVPTTPTKGKRRNGIYESGFGNMFNAYCWSLKNYKGRLHLGTWDSAIYYKTVLTDVIKAGTITDMLQVVWKIVLSQVDFSSLGKYNYELWLKGFIESFVNYPASFGFDYMTSVDGFHFKAISFDGFHNEGNWGVRNLVEGTDHNLYIGTASPTQGCEVWMASSTCDYGCDSCDESQEDEENYWGNSQ